MSALFYSMVCLSCTPSEHPVAEPHWMDTHWYYGYIILRGYCTRRDVIGEEKYLFRYAETARCSVLWKSNPYLVRVKTKVPPIYTAPSVRPGEGIKYLVVEDEAALRSAPVSNCVTFAS